MGAVIYDKNTIISCGFNVSLRSVRSINKKFQRWPGSVHAEVSAILNARTDLDDCNMFVIRINKVGDLMMSKPCGYCYAYMFYVGIKNVTYYNGNKFIKEKIL
jgi:deoxycytidylate deaminase